MLDCPKCKTQSAEGVQFCPSCGEALTDHAKSISQPKRKKGSWAVAILAWVFVAALLAFLWPLLRNARRLGAERSQPAQVLGGIVPQTHIVPIVNSAAAVGATALSWYTFTVPPNASAVSVTGHLAATGGSGNDIECYVVDEDGLANLKNGHTARTYFNSGKVTQAGIVAILPNVPATYHLVLDNRYSLLTPKAVKINANLTYTQ